MASHLRSIDIAEFARRLRSDEGADKRFALFLGAGCSVSSGIPAASELVRQHWVPRLRALYAPPSNDTSSEWIKSIVPGYDPDNPGASYGAFIDRLFLTPQDRQREIERLCDGRTPGFGYAVLAQLVAQPAGRFNVVLTTNFDDLVADALYLYTTARPLVIQHESLATFIRPTRTRPLVIKLHGDHRLSPRNTALETETLAREIRRHTALVLHDRGLIFIGYGGADRGIHELLKELPPEALPFGAYWIDPREPRGEIAEWLADHGIWVRSDWFDDVMLLIQETLDLPHPDPGRFEEVFSDYNESLIRLSQGVRARPDSDPRTAALKKALRNSEASLPPFWKRRNEALRQERIDPNRADALYQELLEEFETSSVLASYGKFLHRVRGDLNKARELFGKAVALDPGNASIWANYAPLLEARGDLDAAESAHAAAERAAPYNADIVGNYAWFLKRVRKDADSAEQMYKRALSLDPRHPTNLGNYAMFLKNVRSDVDAAEAMFERALEADPQHARNLGNYALFCYVVRENAEKAEHLFERAVAAAPRASHIVINFAGYLLAMGKARGHQVLVDAENLASLSAMADEVLEASFFLYLHGAPERRERALDTLLRSLSDGARSEGTNLNQNIRRAVSDGHSDAEWLVPLADVIAGRVPIDALDGWTTWQNARGRHTDMSGLKNN